MGFDEDDAGLIELAVDEACSNVIRHAYRENDQGSGILVLSINQEDERLVISLSDTGPPFDPRTLSLPDLEQHRRQYRQGGLGVYLIRTLMDHLDYNRTEHGNEFIMVKYLPDRKPS